MELKKNMNLAQVEQVQKKPEYWKGRWSRGSGEGRWRGARSMPLLMPMMLLMAVTINLFSFQVLKRKGVGYLRTKGTQLIRVAHHR